MSKEITEDDISSVCYFIEEKDDITRWAQWEERKDVIFEVYPELKYALEQERMAKRLIQCVLDKMGSDIY